MKPLNSRDGVFTPPGWEVLLSVAQGGFHHAATRHQPGQVRGEFVRLHSLLSFPAFLRPKEQELQLARSGHVEALAHKHLLALLDDQHRSFTRVVNLLVRGWFLGRIAKYTRGFLV